MRPPDLTIGPKDRPQTLRWHLLRWRGWQIALHHWLRSDNDRALHDHTSWNISVLLWGTYREWFSHSWEAPRWKLRIPLVPYFRRAGMPHRVELHRGKVWTLWIRGPSAKDWYFWCSPSRKVHWRDYLNERDYSVPGSTSTVGNGCG